MKDTVLKDFEVQGEPGHMLFKESIHLSLCAEYFHFENCSEKVYYCSFSMRWKIVGFAVTKIDFKCKFSIKKIKQAPKLYF